MAIFKSMFKKTGYIKIGSQPEEKGPSVPDGMWLKCSKCKKMVYREDVKEKFYTCPKCGDYFRIKAKTRLRLLLIKEAFRNGERISKRKIRLIFRNTKKNFLIQEEKQD